MIRSDAVDKLIAIGRTLSERGWLRATSGNLSVRDPDSGSICITRSGADKQRLGAADILALDGDGTLSAGHGKPSFETPIHLALYRATGAGAVFHVHTIYNNLVTRHAAPEGLALQSHEMLKALGHWDEDARIVVPVVPNYANMVKLANAVFDAVNPSVPGVLLDRHGIYAFGSGADEALRHLEAFEFLFEWLCLARMTEAFTNRPLAPVKPADVIS